MNSERLIAVLTIEPKNRFKTVLKFSFDYCEIHGGFTEFYGVLNEPLNPEDWPLDEAIRQNEVGDLVKFDQDEECLSVESKDILSLRICTEDFYA